MGEILEELFFIKGTYWLCLFSFVRGFFSFILGNVCVSYFFNRCWIVNEYNFFIVFIIMLSNYGF